MTRRERELRWQHHVVAVSVRPFDPAYALHRVREVTGATIDEIRDVLREHGSLTFGAATPGLLCEDVAGATRLLGLESGRPQPPRGVPCRRPQCGERPDVLRGDGYCSLDCAVGDRAAAA